MTAQQLRYIIAIDEEGGTREAAAKCGISQPTLTVQVQKLEKELKVQIFDREHFPLSATEIGTAIIAQAKIVLKEMDLINDIIKSRKRGKIAPIRQPIITKDKELSRELKKQKEELNKAINLVSELKESLNALSESQKALTKK